MCSSFGESSRVIDPGYSRQSECTGWVQKLWFKLKLLIIAFDQYYLDCCVTRGQVGCKFVVTFRLQELVWYIQFIGAVCVVLREKITDEISKFQRRLLCSFEMERACRATDILDAKCIIDFIDSVYSARFPAPTTGPRPYRVAPLLKRPKMIHLWTLFRTKLRSTAIPDLFFFKKRKSHFWIQLLHCVAAHQLD